MELQNPFSIYDFLGYMIPGLYLILGITYIENFPNNFDIHLLLNLNTYTDVLLVVVMSYIVGHISSFISSISIEKYSVWTIGYPSKYLLNKERNGYFASTVTKYKKEKKRYSGFKKVVPVVRLIVRLSIKLGIFCISLPISSFDLLTRKGLRLNDQYARPLDIDLQKCIRTRLNKFLKDKYDIKGAKDQDHDFFRLIYHHALEYSTNHVPKLQNYVSLYGFTRTSTFSVIILFWYSFYRMLKHGTLKVYWYYLLLISVLAFILYLSFNKFFRKFTLEAIMALTVLEHDKEK